MCFVCVLQPSRCHDPLTLPLRALPVASLSNRYRRSSFRSLYRIDRGWAYSPFSRRTRRPVHPPWGSTSTLHIRRIEAITRTAATARSSRIEAGRRLLPDWLHDLLAPWAPNFGDDDCAMSGSRPRLSRRDVYSSCRFTKDGKAHSTSSNSHTTTAFRTVPSNNTSTSSLTSLLCAPFTITVK
jgi:hypothetical protein